MGNARYRKGIAVRITIIIQHGDSYRRVLVGGGHVVPGYGIKVGLGCANLYPHPGTGLALFAIGNGILKDILTHEVGGGSIKQGAIVQYMYNAPGPTDVLDRKRVTVRIGIILQDRDNNGVSLDNCGCIIFGHGRLISASLLLSPDWLRTQ